MDDPLRADALRLLRAARDIYVEEHGGDEESFRARTSLDLVERLGGVPASPPVILPTRTPSSGWKTGAQ